MGVIFINPYRFGFNPLSLSPALWLDASDTSTITSSSGAVSQWNDKSGNGRNVTQATAANQPTTGATTKNSRNVINFDGGDWLGPTSSGIDPAANGVTVFSVSIATDDTVSIVVISQQDGTGLGRNWIGKDALNPYATFLGGSNLFVGSATTAWVTSRVSCAAGASKTLSFVQNATTTATATRTLESATGGFMIGTRKNNFATQAWKGSIAEVIVFGRELAAGEIADIDTYLNAKWAVY